MTSTDVDPRPIPPFRRSFDAARDPYAARNALGLTGTPPFAPINSPIFTGDPQAPTPPPGDNDQSIPTTAWVTSAISTAGAGYQPIDADLTSIAGYGGTGTWLYRSAANTWSAVTVGSGLSFSGGTLSATTVADPQRTVL